MPGSPRRCWTPRSALGRTQRERPWHEPLRVTSGRRPCQDAVAAARAPGAAYLAAGTNLVDLMKGGVVRPGRLVDVSRLPGLDQIEHLPGGGDAHRRAGPQRRPCPRRGVRPAVSPQWRRRCCPARRPSCATPPLLAATFCSERGAPISTTSPAPATSASPARAAMRRAARTGMHAILGWSEHCIATHPSDFCVPLAALGAVVEIEGHGGQRDGPLGKFPPPAGRHAGVRNRAGARRTDRGGAAAG